MAFFKNVASRLAEGESLVMAVILARSGSAPRSVGSRMAIRKDGSIEGTIGGGVLEARVQELAASVFQSTETVVRTFTLTAEDASLMGMICGGQVRLLIHHVDATQPVQSLLYGMAAETLHAHREGWLVTRIPEDDQVHEAPLQGLLGRDDLHAGTLERAAMQRVLSQFGGRQPDMVRLDEGDFLVEPLSQEGCVFIFGAGHISRDLAPLARLVGFRTVVLDDRPEFANRERFPDADEVHVIPTFDRAMDDLEIDGNSCLVLVTRGHAHDKTVLELSLKTEAGYIGMIGSRRKRDAIYEALLKEGFTQEDIDRVHSPIGLDIGAETPAEIAVSIVAELIQHRARSQ
ncbi:MAG: XdhC family aldehyde oxidoreductase maturation factor [Syntrophobacteraceae bacterium]